MKSTWSPYGAMMGWWSPKVKDAFFKGVKAVGDDVVMKELLANSFALPHVSLLMAACIVNITSLFTGTKKRPRRAMAAD